MMKPIQILAIITQDYLKANQYARSHGLLATGWRQVRDEEDVLAFEFNNYVYLDGPTGLIEQVLERIRR